MRRIAYTFLLLSVLTNCTKRNEPAPILPLQSNPSACSESRPLVRTSTELTGRVSFSSDQNMYFISRSVPGTYDSVWIGFVCNLPEAYKVLDKQVIFSGEYRKGPETPVNFAGAENYYLFLTAIR